MIKKTIKIFLILFLSFQYSSGQSKIGTWNVLNVNLKISEKWNVFTEAQLRSLSLYDEFHYYEIKTGGTFKINKQFAATAGFGSYNTYSELGNFNNPIQNKEIRTWLQMNIKQNLGIFVIEQRYRAEQRFTSNGYKNRFRYRIGASIPINNIVIKEKTFYVNVWNEIFLTNKEPFFERNRLLLGIGYEFNKKLAIQTGYIYQFDYKINDETGKDFINVALLYNFDLTNKTDKEFIPTTSD